MLGAQVERPGEVGAPVGLGLARDREDEVDRDAFDAGGAGEGDRAGDVGGVVPALEGFQVAWVEGLCADREAVDAAGAQDVEQLGGRGFGVALEGDLGVVIDREALGQACELAVPVCGLEEGWGAAADEDGVEGCWVLGREAREGVEFSEHAIGEGGLAVLAINDGVEVAVVALVIAEGDVEVEGAGMGAALERLEHGAGGGCRRARALLGERVAGIVHASGPPDRGCWISIGA